MCRAHWHLNGHQRECHPHQTRFAIEEAMAFQKKHRISEQLEIETYTWDVLPDELKTGDIVEYVTKEIQWVKSLLV